MALDEEPFFAYDMENMHLLAEDVEEFTESCFSGEKESQNRAQNKSASKWRRSSLLLLFSAGLFRPRSCCQSKPLRLILWILRLALLFFALCIINAILRPSYAKPPLHYHVLDAHLRSSTVRGRGNVNNEKVYIAANMINEELIRGQWGNSLLELVDLLGEANVFVSIYENDSGNGTGIALRELQDKLRCENSILTGAHLQFSDFPQVHLPNGEERVQRITYLAKVRNQLLRPLDPAFAALNTIEGFQSVANIHFDRILFLNDVHFDPVDALQLLFSTNRGDYRAACAMDFVLGPLYYDTFATRDYDGFRQGLPLYPWFAPIGSSTSRDDVRRQTDAVRVRSCWGGMAAFDAALFQSISERGSHCGSHANTCLPLQFRGSEEPFWEAAECCLIFADIETLYGRSERVFVNPYVRVAYTKEVFNLIPLYRRFERVFEYWQYVNSKIAFPNINARRTHEPGVMVDEVVWQDGVYLSAERRTNSSPLPRGHHEYPSSDVGFTSSMMAQAGHWSTINRKASAGGFCGERRMFVMKKDLDKVNQRIHGVERNWDKIPVPKFGE